VVTVLDTLDSEEQALHERVSNLTQTKETAEDDDADNEESDVDEVCSKPYYPFADTDSSFIEKMGGVTVNFLNGIANGLDDFAAKLYRD
jgi:hypothetical protein